MAKLTKSYIDKLVAPATGYSLHWDEQDRGFGCRITPTGKRTFLVQGRVHGKELRVTIGPYGVFTADQARDAAREHLRSMRLGVDPRDAKRESQAAKVTLRTVADEYMARPGKLKDSSKEQIERHVGTTFSTYEQRPILDISEDYCRKRYRAMLTGGLHGNREGGSPGQANQAFSILRALINFAMRRYKRTDGSPLITHNPVAALRDDWVTLKERDTYIPVAKIGAVVNMLTAAREQAYIREALSGLDLAMFLLWSGCRLGEATELTWDRVNIDDSDPANCWWHLPDPKNRNPIWLPLPSQAVEMLKQRERVKNNPHVFPSWSKSGHIQDPRDLWKKISAVAGVAVSAHDLRRSFTTYGVTECKVDLYKIELLTSHKPHSVTMKHYLETKRLQYLQPEIQQVADWIERKALVAASGNVVELRPQKTA
jgi:integrase